MRLTLLLREARFELSLAMDSNDDLCDPLSFNRANWLLLLYLLFLSMSIDYAYYF